MLIVLDTNVVFSDPLLNKAPAVTVNDTADKPCHRLTLPQVVFDEAVQKRREQAEEAVRKLRTALAGLNHLGLKPNLVVPGDGDIDKAIAEYTGHLDRLFPVDTRLPYPNESHDIIALRAMSKRRPFTKSDRGYRDTLIWLSVVGYLKESDEPVILVSGDSAFRKSNDTNEPHEDLLGDLFSEGIESTRITLYRNLGELVGDYIAPELDTLESIKTVLEDSLLSRKYLEDEVSVLLNESIYEVSYGSYKEMNSFTV
ncbi:MAG: DUF4935 domain-containing protein, partial [Chloroflexi bacterium]|nr:DUF4935 domain-containing protein [Chloroflexota bacterium]